MGARLEGTVMHRKGCDFLIAGFFICVAVGSQPSEAQYTANFQTNLISGVASNWTPDYYVGNTTFGDVLLIQNSGVLSNGLGFLGYNVSSSNNTVALTGSGSVWSNRWGFYVGYSGAGNNLVISNGGQVVSDPSGSNNYADYIGNNASSSNNTVLVTGSGSVWNDGQRLYVGYSGAGNSLVISNGGQVVDNSGTLGNNPSGSNNTVLVADAGSIWSNVSTLVIGVSGPGNTLVISNAGQVVNTVGSLGGGLNVGGSHSNNVFVTGSGSVWNNNGGLYVGGGKGFGNTLFIDDGGVVTSTNGVVIPDNHVVVTGTGSVWSNSGDLYLGVYASAATMVISNDGQVINNAGYVGSTGSGNSVHVASGGVWQNNALIVGNQGSSNSLAIAGGAVSATNLVIGAASVTCDNFVQLDSGTLALTNGSGNAVFEVRHGKLILNGGVLQADTLVMTNPCASFVHTGGTLIVGNVILDANTFRIVSVVRQSNDMLVTWMMGPGATNTLQATAGDGSGGYSTNSFTDIFIVTNNTAIGTVTNYLDLGAATNKPARYYRARLVP